MEGRQLKEEPQGTASVLKALQLLDVFASGGGAMGVSEIARKAGIATSTAFRLLAYLVEGGFVAKEGTQYRPGAKLFQLGNQVGFCQPQGLRESLSPYLGDLYAATGMTARLAILERDQVVIVNKIVGLRSVPAPTAIGGRVPVTCTALGKSMLAFQSAETTERILQSPLARLTRHSLTNRGLLLRQLQEIRSTRLAFDREESVLGQVCVGVPIIRDGLAVAALSLSAPTRHSNFDRAPVVLRRVADQIERYVAF